MSHIAIDLVLLLSDQDEEFCIEQSRSLDKTLILNKDHTRPHISLAMGVIKQGELPEITQKMAGLWEESLPLQLNLEGLRHKNLETGESVVSLEVQKHATLESMHKGAMHILLPYLQESCTSEMFDHQGDVHPLAKKWVETYKDRTAFSPHITLGFGRLGSITLPPSIQAETLAICHLGNFCTCQTLLQKF